ncbi:serine proteinase [Fusarium austroafricanum]|uniref:Serine proteinase n=1 Tax=Fusarium austroafricanum TaxID=2364996 RepID=A0A8H4NPM6_9HYPO|nr:serine proteinase [Fusarium austroafricanum]
MPGIASIYTTDALDGKKLHVFYTATNNHLAFEYRDEGRVNDSPETLISSNEDIPGIILDNSQITSSYLIGTQIVTGFTKKRKDGATVAANGVVEYDDKFHSVSVLSPVYFSLDKTQKDNLTIASCNSDNDAWVYYFNERGTPEDRLLVETHVNSGEQHEVDDTISIDKHSSLAAYYDPENDRRSVIIQSSSNSTFYEYIPEGDGDTQHLKYTDDAQSGTTMAIAYVNGTVYLYYTNRSQEIRVVTKQVGKSWGSPQEVKGSQVDAASQLTVVASEKGNHLFYVAKGHPKSKINHVLHKR